MVKVSIAVVMFAAIGIATLTAGLVGFIPTYEAGRDSIDETITVLRKNVVSRVELGTRLYFSPPANIINTVSTQGSRGIDLVDVFGGRGDPRETFRYLCGIMIDLNGTSPTVGLYDYGAPDSVDPNHRGVFFACDNRFGFTQVCRSNTTGGLTVCDLWDLTSNDYVGGVKNGGGLKLPFDVKLFDAAERTLLGAKFDDVNHRWGPVKAGYETITLQAKGNYVDARGNTSSIRIGLLANRLYERLFSTLELTPGSRAMLVDGATDRIFGASWRPDPAEQLANWSNLRLPDELRFTFFTPSSTEDELIRKVTASVGGNRGYFSSPDGFSRALYSGKDKVFLDVKRYTDPYGLDVAIVVAMPEQDFVGKVEKQQTTTIIVIVVLIVVLLVLAVAFSMWLARPLDDLGHRMYLTASLQDDDEEVSPSVLSEIWKMQSAYESMKTELTRMKAYLPQSLLKNDDDEEDEEDAGEVSESSASKNSRSRDNSVTKMSDRASQRSASTRVSSSKRGAAVAALKMSREVNNKRVVVAVFNLCDFHRMVRQNGTNSAAIVLKTQKALLDIVREQATGNRGVVDVFQGDRVVVTFNAVTNCASPAKRAASCGLQVCQDAAKQPNIPPVTVGIAQSQALVGNMGTDGLLRFNVVGPCVSDAFALERFARSYYAQTAENEASGDKPRRPYCVVVSSDLLIDIGLEFYYESVDIVRCSTQPKVASVLQQPRAMANDEWMYQIEEGQNKDPFQKGNEAFAAAAAGNADLVRESLPSISSSAARERLEAIIAAPSLSVAATSIAAIPDTKGK